jgi:hypothetical protein
MPTGPAKNPWAKGKMPTQYSPAELRKANGRTVKGFKSYPEAERHGYFSAKNLKQKFGLSVPERVLPLYDATVSTNWGAKAVYTLKQCRKPEEVRRETSPAQIPEIPDHYKPSSPPPSPPHYDMDHVVIQESLRYLRQETPETENKDLRRRKTYLPEHLDLEKALPELVAVKPQVESLLDILHRRRIQEKLGREDFVPLKARYLQDQLGWDASRKPLWDSIREPLLLSGLLECDHHYEKGTKCFGYRLGEKYRQEKTVLVETQAPKARRKDQEKPTLPVHKQLVANLQSITLDPSWHEDVPSERFQDCCQMIDDRQWWWRLKDESGHRFHWNLTNTPRDAKKYIRVDGTSPVEIDISNSQLWALAMLLKQRGTAGCEEFIRFAERGEFYDHFTRHGFSRQEVKDEFRENILFKRNGYQSRIKTAFKQEFPAVNAAMEKWKEKDPKTFAKLLQRTEAKFCIYTVAERLCRMGIWCVTIHDSFLVLPDDREAAINTIQEAARELGMTITNKVKDYGLHD